MNVKRSLNIGVSGVGGGCGQGIMKALMQVSPRIKVFPADITHLAAGLYRGQEGTVLPKPEENISAWRSWIEQNQLVAVFPGSDHDLMPFALVKDEWKVEGLTQLVVSNRIAVSMANDKWMTVVALQTAELPYPRTWKFEQNMSYVFDGVTAVVVKPRFGMTSRGVHVCRTGEELFFHLSAIERPIIQEYIEGDEYTCSVLCDRKGDVKASFIMKRVLVSGVTHIAEPVEMPELTSFLIEAVKKFKLQHIRFFGGINFQLRIRNGIPYIFEINARSSGSTAMRAHFGYNEPAMMIGYLFDGERLHQPVTTKGVAFRFGEELFVDDVTLENLKEDQKFKGRIPSWL